MNATSTQVAGTEPGQRQLNGPQTTGREYRSLSRPQYAHRRDDDVAVPMRDGITLLADVHRPAADGKFPALIAASPYPRQIQDLGAPMGFVEAGASDYFVPRGYVHVIANLRGTGGSGGTFGLFDPQERRDLHDLVEWAAAQSWCDGNVGMIGISYFAMTQLEAAVERPPHLKAIFPVAVSSDLYDAARPGGLFSSTFMTPFVAMLGITSEHDSKLWRGKVLNAARKVLNAQRVHEKFAHRNGESAVGVMKVATKLGYDPEPWDDLWEAVAVEHQRRDEWWDERNLLPLLDRVEIPVYLGCDWQNVPLHLPSTFTTLAALSGNDNVRVALLGDFGLTWPWESLHIEALAWFDQWLKGRDTGIMDGPPIRYWLPGEEAWRAADSWPPPETVHQEFALRADGRLSGDEGPTGERSYTTLGSGLGRDGTKPTDPLRQLVWTSDPLSAELDVVGDIELRLVASSSATDTAWIVLLADVGPDGDATAITQGYLQASLREVDESTSRPGAPDLPCRTPQLVPPGEEVFYRIPLVPNARRVRVGHRLQLTIVSDDQHKEFPATMDFRHAPVGTSSRNTVLSSSRLLLPVQL